MTTTVRRWSKQDLDNIVQGKDSWLATVFMNAGMFSEEEIRSYPYLLRKTYVCSWNDSSDDAEFIKIYATDDAMALKYLQTEYVSLPTYLAEITTTYRQVALPTT